MTNWFRAAKRTREFSIHLSLAAIILALAGLSSSTALHKAISLDVPLGIGFGQVVAHVKPAVFGVTTKSIEPEGDAGMTDELLPFGESPDMREDLDEPPPKRPRLVKSEGSGFFISPDGYAVTANHVVEQSKSIKITMNDGKTYPARLVGADAETDIALLKVQGNEKFPFVELAPAAPKIGEWVIAVGNPFGLGGSVTAGIVSASSRDVMWSYNEYVQIDAPVNIGDSGGPTFDVRGKVIGVNSAIFTPSGGSVGIGFAVPAKTVRSVVPQLKQKGMVTRGWMGVQIQEVTPEIADSLSLDRVHGALIAEADAGGPAAKAGILPGDVVMSLKGSPVRGRRELVHKIRDVVPGTIVELGLIRQGAVKTVNVRLGQHPVPRIEPVAADEGSELPETGMGASSLGLMLVPGTNLDPDTKGVVVIDVESGGVAAERGLEPGDIILDVGGMPVDLPSDVDEALNVAPGDKRHNVLARVNSGKSTRFVAMPVG